MEHVCLFIDWDIYTGGNVSFKMIIWCLYQEKIVISKILLSACNNMQVNNSYLTYNMFQRIRFVVKFMLRSALDWSQMR